MTPETAVQKAVTELLLADATVSSFVGGKVFDEIPADGAAADEPPYIDMGALGSALTDLDSEYLAWTVTLRLYVYSTEFGRNEAWDIAHAARKAVHYQEPELEAPFVLQGPLKAVRSGDVLDPQAAKSIFLDVTATVGEAT